MFNILALANVVERPIVSVYPEANDLIRMVLHTTVFPFNTNLYNEDSFILMWSRDGDLDRTPGVPFSPNHFVPLVQVMENQTNLKRPTDDSVSKKVPIKKKKEATKDIRHFFTAPKKPNLVGSQNKPEFVESINKPDTCTNLMPDILDTTDEPVTSTNQTLQKSKNKNIIDIGSLTNAHLLSPEEKYEYLKHHFTPHESYNYAHFRKQHVEKGTRQYTLTFQNQWLTKYPWLVYSPEHQGGFCKYCVLFPPTDERVKSGVFVSKTNDQFQKGHW